MSQTSIIVVWLTSASMECFTARIFAGFFVGAYRVEFVE